MVSLKITEATALVASSCGGQVASTSESVFLGLPRWEVCQHIDCWYKVTVVSEFSELYRIILISVAILLILDILEMCVKA